MRYPNFFYNLSLKKILRYLFYWQVTALVTTDNKDQDSRLPDYALKISRVFIHICLFIPLIIILRLKLDTFNSEERGTLKKNQCISEAWHRICVEKSERKPSTNMAEVERFECTLVKLTKAQTEQKNQENL